jgi:hypothetical protein
MLRTPSALAPPRSALSTPLPGAADAAPPAPAPEGGPGSVGEVLAEELLEEGVDVLLQVLLRPLALEQHAPAGRGGVWVSTLGGSQALSTPRRRCELLGLSGFI